MSQQDKVEQYITKKKNWEVELRFLRQLLLDAQLEETIKWGAPVYGKDGKNLIGLSAFKNYVGLWFFNGNFLKDEQTFLANAQEGKTKSMRQWRFSHMDEMVNQKDTINAYIIETKANHDKGWVNKPAQGKALVTPQILQAALDKDNDLEVHFEALPLSKRREYAEYITEAKRESTKISRLEKIIPMILEGKGLHDKYRS